MSVIVREFKPSPKTNQFVDLYWEGSFNMDKDPEISQRVVPSGYIELIIHITDWHCDLFKNGKWGQSPDYTLIGIYTKPYTVKFSDLVNTFGIRFKPDGFYNVFGVPVSEFKHTFDDMESLAGREFREFCSRLRDIDNTSYRIMLAEKYLRKKVEETNIDFGYLNRAAEIIRKTKGFIKIEELAKKSFISMRQLEREFVNKIGITPKMYMRISRLNEVNRVLESRRELKLTDVTYECGFSDQAHFIREFKNFTGETPKVFIKDKHKFMVIPGTDPAETEVQY